MPSFNFILMSAAPQGTGSVIYAFQQSDVFSRAIVAMLCLASVYVWTLMAEKALAMRKARMQNARFIDDFRKHGSFAGLGLQFGRHDGPLAVIYQSAFRELCLLLELSEEKAQAMMVSRDLPRALSEDELDRLRRLMERRIDGEIMQLEGALGNLGTAVTVSPFLGLLGTVWGVMAAFCGMAQAGRPDIRVLAPGVSGALLTTVVGLVVAIPAVVGYNFLVQGVRHRTTEMERFAEDFIEILRLESRRAGDGGRP